MDTSFKKQMNWHLNILPRTTQKALNFLSKQKWLKLSPWYLAGGTSLAIQVGHRSSVDLDFFTPKREFNNISVLKHFKNSWITTINKEGTIYGELYKAKVSFIANPLFHPQLKPYWFGFIKVIKPLDIAVMKVVAISQRGRKRDFFDLYWCAHHLEPLKNIIIRLNKQYPTIAHDFHHILKSLVYFEDAEGDPTPQIFFKANWKQVKKFFSTEVPKITKEIIGRQ